MITTNETACRQIADAIAKDYPDKPVRAIAAQDFVECRNLTVYGLGQTEDPLKRGCIADTPTKQTD